MTGEAKTVERKTTDYLVLAYHQESGAWRSIQTVAAVSSDAAIREVAGGTEAPDATKFVAVPARSWKPRSITVETAPRVKLS